MIPTKEEMERVWNEEQPGWLKTWNKERKGKDPYVLVAKPHIRQPLDPVEVVVWAKSSQKAMKDNSYAVSKAVLAKYPRDQYPEIGWTTGVKPIAR